MQNFDWLAEGDEPTALSVASEGYLRALVDDQAAVRTTRDGIPLGQILADRPDVFRAYFEEFHSVFNDKHSDAWVQRVGGTSVEDYANYWYEQHGRWEGYGAQGGGAGAPLEDGAAHLLPGIVETGRTTADGIPLSQILTDRPDVFRAFFTEFYGANNDHKSSAWANRVGGDTVEDYANYWYEHHGKWSGYVPHTPEPEHSAPEPQPEETPDMSTPPTEAEDPPGDAAAGLEPLDDSALLVGGGLFARGDDLGF